MTEKTGTEESGLSAMTSLLSVGGGLTAALDDLARAGELTAGRNDNAGLEGLPPTKRTRSHSEMPAIVRQRTDENSESEEEGDDAFASGLRSESNNNALLSDDKNNGRRKIEIKYIEDKSRRHITFSKRKAGIMKKAYELSTLTGTQVLLLVASETGHVYTFATPKLQPLITKQEGKNLIQTCLNAPDVMPPLSLSNQPSLNGAEFVRCLFS